MSTQPDFHLDYPWYRRHDAQLIELLAAQWGGVRVELVTREAVGPCDGGMCVPHHVVSFLTEGRRSGVINSIEGIYQEITSGAPVSVPVRQKSTHPQPA